MKKQMEQHSRHSINNSKVQFFQSQSSFASESVFQGSRCDDFTQQIVINTESIFHSLQKYLSNTPLQKNVDRDYLLTVYNRARILNRQNIPQHYQYLKKIGQSDKSIQIITKCSQQLSQIIKDYQSYQSGQINYQTFCRKYQKQNQSNGNNQISQSEVRPFSKKSKNHQQLNIKPQIIEIRTLEGGRLKGGYMNLIDSRAVNKQQVGKKDKEIMQLNEKIIQLNKRQKDFKRLIQMDKNRYRIETQQRINNIIKLSINDFHGNDNNQKNQIRNILARTQEDLKDQFKKNSQLDQQNRQLQSNIEDLKKKIKLLENQSQNGKKKLSDSQVSSNTIITQVQNAGGDPKKMQKIIRNLVNDKTLLKKQLHRQRQLNYSLKIQKEQQLQNEIKRLNQQLRQKNQQNKKLLQISDKLKIENIKLRQNGQFQNKMLISLQTQNKNLKKDNSDIFVKDTIGDDKPHRYGDNNHNKPSVSSYEGDSIEGYFYYELLNKQFKVRFRRSCLKQKQLLYKSNGLEIGMISHFNAQNEIKIVLHLTNYSDILLKEFQFKIMNPNDNKFRIQKQKIQQINIGEQIKINLHFTIKNYPIGPFILICNYVNQGKTQDLRLLLPIHIFKLTTFHLRELGSQLRKPTSLKPFEVERKIVKDFGMLKGYFLSENEIIGNCLKMEAIHEHTGTITFIDIKLKSSLIEISYENQKGNQKITQYFIKTLQSLLTK